MADTVQLVKEKLSILDVVQPYVKLTRAGKYWKGLSPFTKEKTPSFFVSPDRGLYHCFSTGKGGDMFTFIEEMEGVDFKGSLKLLAEKAGVPLKYEKSSSDERERIFEALSAAQDFFVKNREARSEVNAYLVSRGLKPETIEAWGIGYALPEWQSLHTNLMENGFKLEILERAGLVKRPDTEGGSAAPSVRYYDRFRGRIMFPIRDVSGRVTGFSGRLFPDDSEGKQAKYLNSPETLVFEKSKVLYGIDVAREGIRSLGSALLVEGQFDLIMAHQAGYRNAIATSGTAFTKTHAESIRRYTPNLLIAYDGDRAGVAAAGRASAVSLPLGLNVKVAKLPPGEDPADALKDHPEVFKTAIREGVHIVDFYLAHLLDAKYDARTFRLEVSRTVLPYVAMIENRIDQAHFIKRVAEVLSVPEEAVAAELQKLTKKESPKAEETAVIPEPFLSRTDSIERLAFGLMLLMREAGKSDEASRIESALKEAVGEERLKVLAAQPDTDRGAIFGADLFLTQHGDDHEQAIADVCGDLLRESLHERYRESLAKLREAEKTGDQDAAETLMEELSRLAKSLA